MLSSGDEDVKVIGLYTSREKALEVIGRLSKEKGFRDHPNLIDPLKDEETEGFYIEEYEFDSDHWKQGFISF